MLRSACHAGLSLPISGITALVSLYTNDKQTGVEAHHHIQGFWAYTVRVEQEVQQARM